MEKTDNHVYQESRFDDKNVEYEVAGLDRFQQFCQDYNDLVEGSGRVSLREWRGF